MFDITISGDIDNESYVEFSDKLAALETSTRGTVRVQLISDGGSAYSAMAFFDRIQNSRKPIHITATGTASSAAVLILAAGHKRFMTKNAWVMVHEDLSSCNTDIEEMRVTEAEREIAHLRKLEDRWNDLLARVTTTPAWRWSELHKNSAYLNAQDCLALGLIEEIV